MHKPLAPWLCALLLLAAAPALAHKPSDSYLTLHLDGAVPRLQWDIALRDLEFALGLDADGDGAITWGELRARREAVAGYALARLGLDAGGGGACALSAEGLLVDEHSDGVYAVLPIAADCPAGGALTLDYRLFFDLDPTHRGLVKIHYPDRVETAVLSPERPLLSLDGVASPWRQFADYWWEGVWHIWIGFDHILFLLALLLPSVLWREAGRWRAAASFRGVVWDVAGVVTAFTVAHSITLAAAVLGWVSLPSRLVESAIAATVVLAALNNLYPLVRGRRWVIAFVLGLIHGFGFASVLADLGLPGGALALALVGFNLGVETGQLAIVAVFLPLAFALRESWFYRRAALGLGSLAVAALALVWLLERSLNIQLLAL